MDFDMRKNIEFDNNFSFPTKNMTVINDNTDDNTRDFLLSHNNLRDISSGKHIDNTPKEIVYVNNKCEKENKIINEQSMQLLLLLDIINAYHKENSEYKLNNANKNKTIINVSIIIFVIILIITMVYVNKYRKN